MITSVQNSKIKLVRSLLTSKREREENGLYIIEGVRLAEEALNAGMKPQFTLFSSQLSERGREIIQYPDK